ncbi:hypothetical protein [Streptomyces sp. NPDC054784]
MQPQLSQPRAEITYRDELLADRTTVHRRYADGRQEWRVRAEGHRVAWRDDRGGTGTDELLGRRIVKRAYADGRPALYGRESGFGRTLWSDGVLTVNRTAFGGRVGPLLVGAATAAGLVGALAAPPLSMSPEEEEELRREAEAAAVPSPGGGGDAGGDEGGDGGYGDWDGDGGDDGGDFG